MRVLTLGSVASALLLTFVFAGSLAAQDTPWVQLKGDPVAGKQVFQVTACWRCHDIETGVSKRPPAPSLKGVFQRPPHTLADGTKHDEHTDAMLGLIIRQGTKAMNPRGAVLTDQEVADLLAYLHTL